MTGGSESSNTPDFAFEPPVMSESSSNNPVFDSSTKSNPYSNMSGGSAPNGGFAQPFPPYFSGPGSSFSSSSTGASFSSIDALPAISRDFHRPANSETRRPATAGGALQSFGLFDERKNRDDGKPETIDESAESLFSNPFDAMPKDNGKSMVSPDLMDPHFNPRRSNDAQHQLEAISTSWQENSSTPEQNSASPHTPFSMASTPAHMAQFAFMNGPHQQMQMNRVPSSGYATRPQTSDGLPSYHGVNPNGVSLPSARTLVNQLDPGGSFPSPNNSFFNNGAYPGVRDARAASMGDIDPQANGFPSVRHYSMSSAPSGSDPKSSELTFVPLGGPAPKKRPRRRYDEIERLYTCGWNGCEKAYGTLNHLNAHVAMQKHGEKRLPSEFKDMRKAWRKRKREQAAAAANAQYMATSSTWNPRASISSGSEYDRRESNASFVSTSDYSSHRGSVVYSGYQWDPTTVSRPTTSSSVASSSDGRFPASAYASGMINASPAARRSSGSGHMAMPVNPMALKMDGTMGTHPNGFARPPSAQNPYPFQSLTSPMPMMAQQGQFAFQR